VNDKIAKFKYKSLIKKKKREDLEEKGSSLGRYFDIVSLLSSKFSLHKNFAHQVKIMHDVKKFVPKVGLDTLFFHEPLFLGLNYIFDKDSDYFSDSFETVLGVRPHHGFLAYLKQYQFSVFIVK